MLRQPLPSPFARVLAWGQHWQGHLLSSVFGGTGQVASSTRAAVDVPLGDECRNAMRSVLESEIIPRLLQGRRPGAANAVRAASAAPSVQVVESFAALCAAGDRAACTALVERLREEGLHTDSVLMDLVAPAARHLGEQWEDDRLDFASVTIGLVLMHELIHTLGYEVQDGPQVSGAVRRVMLASAPGSQHVLGLSIVSEFFRKAGWQVVLEVSPTSRELCRAVSREWFDLLGLSVALDGQLPGLPTLIAELHKSSCNPGAPVLLGGPVFVSRNLQAEQFGAQAICLDARESLDAAARLVTR